ncbi:MAG TPA: OsmC family protein [Flavobacteriaceae bacterium]|nr:OsmC family protein [Flavobacteriaceae bacterium]
MKITLFRVNENFHFETKNENGNVVHLDHSSAENPQGPSPMELLLMGIAGCSGIDIVSILRKQQLELSDLKMEVEGVRIPGAVPNVFTEILMKIFMEGDIPKNKAQRAVDLSIEKYCSVAKMLEKTAKIEYTVFLNDEALK